MSSPRGAGLLHELLDAAAATRPQGLALDSRDAGPTTFRELAGHVDRWSALLRWHGIARGDRVLVIDRNSAALVAAVLAVSRVGGVFVVLNPGTTAYQLRHVVQDCTPTAVLASAAFTDVVDGALSDLPGSSERPAVLRLVLPGPARPPDERPSDEPVPVRAEDPVALIYTSGSTSMPKAVVSTHASTRWATSAIQARLRLTEGDRVATFLPLAFDYGLYQVFLALEARATLLLHDMSDVGPGLLRLLEGEAATVLPVVPSMAASLLRLLERRPVRLPLRLITSTGAHFPAAHVQALGRSLPDAGLALMYGLTECKRVSILLPEETALRPGSVGRPLDGTRCTVVDRSGAEVAAGVRGELVVEGPHVMAGYWNAPELTAARFRRGPDGARILATGDTCSKDEEGYLYFHGRDDDVFKRRGFRVGVLEVEAAATDLDGVDGAALIIDDPEQPVLVVRTTLTEDAVLAGLRQRLEDYKLPAGIVVVSQLPLTSNGKLDKQELRRALTATA